MHKFRIHLWQHRRIPKEPTQRECFALIRRTLHDLNWDPSQLEIRLTCMICNGQPVTTVHHWFQSSHPCFPTSDLHFRHRLIVSICNAQKQKSTAKLREALKVLVTFFIHSMAENLLLFSWIWMWFFLRERPLSSHCLNASHAAWTHVVLLKFVYVTEKTQHICWIYCRCGFNYVQYLIFARAVGTSWYMCFDVQITYSWLFLRTSGKPSTMVFARRDS